MRNSFCWKKNGNIHDPTPIFLPDTRNREPFLSLTRLIHFTVRSHSESRIRSVRIGLFKFLRITVVSRRRPRLSPSTVGINLISGCTATYLLTCLWMMFCEWEPRRRSTNSPFFLSSASAGTMPFYFCFRLGHVIVTCSLYRFCCKLFCF